MSARMGISLGALWVLVGSLMGTGALAVDVASERWEATSTTSTSITGNVMFSPARIRFHNGASLPLSVAAQIKDFDNSGDKVNATIYRVTVPADPALENGNHLCGGGAHATPVTFVVVWASEALPGDKAPKTMAAFSGSAVPHATSDSSLCGTYEYETGH